jgi:CRISPR-associated exonuclease Cas4
MQGTELLPLRVNDLKQFEYCPRIVFYNTVMPLDRKVTFKMQRGTEAEFRLDALEKRRSLRRYKLGGGERHFHVWLHSERLGLSGKMDLLIVSSRGYFPVDFKYTRGRPHRNHISQLAGYSVLVEDQYHTVVETAFIYLAPVGELVRSK